MGVPATDQDRALAFYVDKRGFETRLDVPVEQFGGHWIEVASASARTPMSARRAGRPRRVGAPHDATGVES